MRISPSVPRLPRLVTIVGVVTLALLPPAVESTARGTPSEHQHIAHGAGALAEPGKDQTLQDVDAATADDAWAVGLHGYSTSLRNLILHWDGQAWSKVPSPDPGTAANGLSGVSAAASDDVWAVGGADDTGDHHGSTVALHWDGTKWRHVPSESPAPADNSFRAVAAISRSDVWAVGARTEVFEGTFDGLIEHWDGTSWSVVTFPDLPGAGSFDGVSGTAADDVWAVGSALVRGRNRGVIEHWDGNTWSIVEAPHPGKAGDILRDVTAVSRSNVWAVGSRFGPDGEQPLVEHWNGSAWAVVDSARPPGRSELVGIDARTAHDVWAVGRATDGEAERPLTQHWDGVSWSVVKVRPPQGRSGLLGVTVPGATTALAVGSVVTADFRFRSLIEAWDGAHWSRTRAH